MAVSKERIHEVLKSEYKREAWVQLVTDLFQGFVEAACLQPCAQLRDATRAERRVGHIVEGLEHGRAS